MSVKKAVVVKAAHDDLGEDTYHEWWFEGRALYLDALARPRNGAMRRWLSMRCNNPDCGGFAWVYGDAIAEHFGPELP